jgi:protein involved in polysaccharide export with SLBB domain
MSRRILSLSKSSLRLSVSSIVVCLFTTMIAFAQIGSPGAETQGDKKGQKSPPTLASQDSLGSKTTTPPEAPIDDQYFKNIYRQFSETYKLGPDDEIAVRVYGHPEHSLERVKVSPMGTIYHNLLGEITVVGVTVPDLKTRFIKDLGEFLVDPKVNVELIEAKSAKIGVLGDVLHPGIVLLSRPMRIVDVISAAGGISDTGDKDDVEVLRQLPDGNSHRLKVNLKRIYEGKSKPEDNIPIQGGDLVIVHGNTWKSVTKIMSLTGIGGFLSFISVAR